MVEQKTKEAAQRMDVELSELREKQNKLADFISREEFLHLDSEVQALLEVQVSVMSNYEKLLKARKAIMLEEEGKPFSFDFGTAISFLESGMSVARTGWNGKNMFVIKQVPAHITSDIIPKMQSLPPYAKRLIMGSKQFVDYTSQCLLYNANTGRADSWVPSISDVFAKDWQLVL